MAGMTMQIIMGTRPCMAMVHFKKERTDEELAEMYQKLGYVPTDNIHYLRYCRDNRYYYETREVKAEWHTFAQETEEDDNGNIQYPVAVIELEDGTVKSVPAENIKFIKEEENHE